MDTWQFVILVVIVNSAIWSYFDASRQRDTFQIGVGPGGQPPHTWASAILVLWPVFMALYLRARSMAQLAEPRSGPPPRFKAGGFNLSAPDGATSFAPETSWSFEAGAKSRTSWLVSIAGEVVLTPVRPGKGEG